MGRNLSRDRGVDDIANGWEASRYPIQFTAVLGHEELEIVGADGAVAVTAEGVRTVFNEAREGLVRVGTRSSRSTMP